ncbi:MAG: S8 family serine peptidase, partial [Clostridia bacterium]|nr:S8 family serine peptidase [Clostridia bacterium]
MKKILSCALIGIILFSVLTLCVCAEANDVSSIDIDTFSSLLCEMVSESGTKSQPADINSARKELKKRSYITEEQRNTFSTMRLLVDSDRNIDTQNAVSVISGYKNIWVLQFASVEDTVNAYDYYSRLSYVSSVEPDYPVCVSETPESVSENSERTFLSWGADFSGFGALLDEIEGRQIETATVSVAIIDTGIDSTHELLKNRVDDTYFNVVDKDYLTIGNTIDENGHGTHVAGIIADCTPDNIRIRPYKVLDKTGIGYVSLVTSGIFRAIEDDVSVINLSLGGKKHSPIQETAIEYAENKGILVVAAAGNQATTNPVYPACYESVIAVASIDENGLLSKFSNYGEYVDISAPGTNIYSSFFDNSYKTLSGTSMASPFVSAVCALAKSIHLDYSNDMLKTLLYSSAIFSEKMETDGYFYGFGLLNAKGILEELPDNINDYIIPSPPVFSEKGGIYTDSIEVGITSEHSETIYYTTDGSIPDINSAVYDGSILKFTETTEIKAVLYSESGRKSKIVSEKYYITRALTEDEITINNDGVITSCITEKEEVYIPETIKGIVPVKIGMDVFSQRNDKTQTIKTLLIPSSVKSIEKYAFYDNDAIVNISADGVVEIGENAFAYCDDFESIQALNL